jgi:hypothetical protein
VNDIFGPFTFVAFGEHAPKMPTTAFETLEEAKAELAKVEIPEGARVLIMGNRRTPFGSMRLPVA